MTNNKIVFFDLETGGLDHRKHPVIQFAGVALEDWEEIDSLELKIRFRLDMADTDALYLNSYDPIVWNDQAVDKSNAVIAISSFLRSHSTVPMISKKGRSWKSCQLAGHNAKFDRDFLGALFDSEREFCVGGFIPLDTLQLAAWWRDMIRVDSGHPRVKPQSEEQPADLKLRTLCDHFSIDLDQAHDALADVRATIHLAKRIREALLDW